MIAARLRIVVLPRSVVHRHPHLLRVAMVEIVCTLHVAIRIKIMRVENVRIVVKTAPILAAGGRSPLLAVRLPTARRRLSLDRSRRQKNRPCQYGSGGKKLPFHRISPLKIELQQEYRLLAQPVFTEKPSISPLRRRALAESLQSVSIWPPELERNDFCKAAHDRKQTKLADAELDAEHTHGSSGRQPARSRAKQVPSGLDRLHDHFRRRTAFG